MIIIKKDKATKDDIKKMLEDYTYYIKVVVDIENEILAGGGELHVDAEQLLIEDGSKQENLWGGGIEWESKKIDYDSIINLRPQVQNPSREILDSTIREQFDTIVKKILL
jgi:hypothetical protein